MFFLLSFRFVFNGKFKSGDQVDDDHFRILDLDRDVDKGLNPHPWSRLGMFLHVFCFVFLFYSDVFIKSFSIFLIIPFWFSVVIL